MKDISILIPTYNHTCVELVQSLQQQANQLPISYEIIVADDGSTLPHTIKANRAINNYTNSRYIERPENAGRAAIRNYLAYQASKPWVLFIDSDMVVRRPDFLRRYVETPKEQAVWDGGISVGGDANLLKNNLRYHYERAAEHQHTAERRQQEPYRDFHTANFMAPKQLMTEYPFDLRFRHYGYEDVLFGMTLESHRIPIHHLDNPLSFEVFEENEQFLNKTEEGLRTLYTFRHELKDGSRLLQRMEYLGWILPLLRLFHHATKKLERRILLRHPSLFLFSLYRLGYFATLSEK
jgi:glycosyltransferase involved in cell wall biosynthesis